MTGEKCLCIGHVLVELPGQADARIAGEMILGFELDIVEGSVAEFRGKIKVRKTEVDSRVMAGHSRSEARGFTGGLLRPYLMLSTETRANPRPGGMPVDSSFHQDALAILHAVSSSVGLRNAGATPVIAEPKKVSLLGQVCLQSDNTVCGADEVMFDIRRLDDRTAFKRQFILSSRRNPIAKPVSTLL